MKANSIAPGVSSQSCASFEGETSPWSSVSSKAATDASVGTAMGRWLAPRGRHRFQALREGQDGEGLRRLGLGARLGHLPQGRQDKRLLIMRLAFGHLPAQAPLDAQKPSLMTGRAHVLFAQLLAVLGPAPPELGQHLGTRP